MIFNFALLAAAAFAPQTNVAPASEANIDAFVKVLPPSEGGHDKLDDSEVEAQKQLLNLNPGRETKVREIVAAHRQCMKPLENNTITEMVRQTARAIGNDRLQLMTEFFRKGEDHKLEPLLAKRQSGTTLSAAEEAELNRLVATYPLVDYGEASKAVREDLYGDPQLLKGIQSCDEEMLKAVKAAGIKYE